MYPDEICKDQLLKLVMEQLQCLAVHQQLYTSIILQKSSPSVFFYLVLDIVCSEFVPRKQQDVRS